MTHSSFFVVWRIRSFFFFLIFTLLLAGCQDTAAPTAEYLEIGGETMGTYYQVTYADSLQRSFKEDIDALLLALNQEVSTYIDTATITAFNRSSRGIPLDYNPFGEDVPHDNQHLLRNFQAAKTISARTQGAFDPTVMPLVNYWGFGYAEKRKVTQVDSARVDSLQQLVGMEKVFLRNDSLVKTSPGVQLDFSALAKGYGVDEIAAFLSGQGVRNYYVEIGGEVVTKGRSPRGDNWRIGISDPQEGAGLRDIQTAVPLIDEALATSGNYRNVYEVNGQKFSHTINPVTGFPERSRLLSASVFAPDCMTADAYATACMVAGPEQALAFAKNDDQIEVYLIISTESGDLDVRYSEGLAPFFNQEQ